MTDDALYTDPATQMHSRAGLVGYIGEVLEKQPGRRILRTSEVDAHSLSAVQLRLVKADGSRGQESIDFVEFAPDGRIHRVTGFFGPQHRRRSAPG